MERNWIVAHDILGMGCHVVDVRYGEVKPEDICQVPKVTPTVSGYGPDRAPAMRMTRLEATLLAAQLDAQLVDVVKAEHPGESWQDWLGNYGYWYACEVSK
jgi:hypothetical protein